MNLKQSIWYPSSIGIIEFKIVEVRSSDTETSFKIQSVRDVGTYTKLQCLIHLNERGQYWFQDVLLYTDDKSSYLEEYFEGQYYSDFNEANLAFLQKQLLIASVNMSEKEKWYLETKKRYEQVKLMVETCTNLIKGNKND